MSRIVTSLQRLERSLDRLEKALVERERRHAERLEAAFEERLRQHEAKMGAASADPGHDGGSAAGQGEAAPVLNAAHIADRLDAVIARLERVLEQ